MKQLHPGDVLDNFIIIDHLKQSRVTNIYTAKDVVYQDVVVLKIPLDNLLVIPELLYHYQNEANISPCLDHPFVVRYLQRPQTHQYLIVEYLKGNTLREKIDRYSVIPLSETLEICRQMADAVDYLHSQNIIHLDIKPDNIIISASGMAKLIDFGIARQVGAEDLLGKDFQEPQGTPNYISPEQLCGDRSCFQSDIYSLGVVVYEMLTGRLPYSKTFDLNEIRERLIKPPVPPRYHNSAIPPVVQEAVLKAMATDPHERYSTAASFIAALDDNQTISHQEIVPEADTPDSLYTLQQSSRHLHAIKHSPFLAETLYPRRHIMGCINDSDSLQLIIAYIRNEALLRGADITLLHVLDEHPQDDVNNSKQSEQEKLSELFDDSLSALKVFDLSPVMRLKKGSPADVILATARELSPDVIVLGPPRPRNFLARIFQGSVLEKVAGAGVANVTIASSLSPPELPLLPDDRVITLQYVHDLEVYLWDAWVIHHNALTNIPQVLTGKIDMPQEHPLKSCRFSHLFRAVDDLKLDAEFYRSLQNCHSEFHQALELMADNTHNGNHDIVRNIYKYRAIPLSIEFKHLLMELIVQLRSAASLPHIPLELSNRARKRVKKT